MALLNEGGSCARKCRLGGFSFRSAHLMPAALATAPHSMRRVSSAVACRLQGPLRDDS